jgi:hypothetical protein
VSQRMFSGGHEGGVRPAASNLVRPSSAEPMQAEAPALADVPPAIPAGAAPPPPSASDLAPSDDEVVPPVAIASLDYLAHEGSLPAPLAQAEQQPALAAVRPAAEAPVLARAETSMSKGRPAANVPAANTRAGKRAAVSSRRKAPEPAEPASASAAAPSAAVSAPEPAMSREVSTTQDPLPGLVERADEAPQQSVPVVPAPVVVADVSSSRAALAAASSLPPTAASSEPPTAAPVPSRARVAIGAIAARAAVSKASVRGALNMDAITGCYRTALRSGRESGNPVTAQIDVVTSTSGSVTSAQMRGSGLSSDLRHCIEQVARRGRVREADTGEAQASITLEFEPR